MIQIVKIEDVWSDLVPTLERVIAKTGEKYTPFDVIAAVSRNEAFVVADLDRPSAFAVCYFRGVPWTNDKTMWIWTAFDDEGDSITAHLADFLEMAKNFGCVSVRWDSTRPAYGKLITKIGGRVVRTEYEVPCDG